MALFAYQQSIVDATWDAPGWGLFLEMGVGKSLITIETARRLHAAGKIDGMLVVAPNGVHANWIYDELPKWGLEDWRIRLYDVARERGHRQSRDTQKWIDDPARQDMACLACLAISYDALLTDRGYGAALAFLRTRRCLLAADESARIKNPKARRTKAVLALAALAPYRRALTGTPFANSPFDLYSQVSFIDPRFWKAGGIGSWWAFRARYGVFEKGYVHGGGGVRSFEKLTGYQNMPDLQARVASISHRVLKKDVLDLPPIVYTARSFELLPAERRMYDQLRTEFLVEFDGGLLTAPLALARLVRLQQITSGLFQPDQGDLTIMPSARLGLLRELLEDQSLPAIIWCRYTATVEQICAMLGDLAVRYDGKTGQADRTAALADFASGKKQYFVANSQAGRPKFNGGAGRGVCRAQFCVDRAQPI
jgi:superfamily II DNA or RNA helicase